jgi:DnaJ-class molecular chaperone
LDGHNCRLAAGRASSIGHLVCFFNRRRIRASLRAPLNPVPDQSLFKMFSQLPASRYRVPVVGSLMGRRESDGSAGVVNTGARMFTRILNSSQVCVECEGTGLLDFVESLICPICNGVGRVFGRTCHGCEGAGNTEYKGADRCPSCNGSGRSVPVAGPGRPR